MFEVASGGNGSTVNTGPDDTAERPHIPGVRRIAVLRANSIGDFVLALPALAALRASYPRAEITYLGDRWHPQLMRGRPGPWDRVDVVPPYAGVRSDEPLSQDSPEIRRFFDHQRHRRYDLAVQIHGGGANSNPFVDGLGARMTVGLRDGDAPALDRWIRYRYYQHEVHRFLEVVGLAGAVPVGYEPTLELTGADMATADALPIGRRLVALHPGANDPRRRWPPRCFAAVADALASRRARVLIVGQGADDAQAASRISSLSHHPPLDLVGRLSLGAMLGVLARCSLVVANDSGPRHLAAAVGTPTVGIFWWRNLVNAGPLTAARHQVAVSARTTCPVCAADQLTERCSHNESFVADVSVDQVVTAAVDLLEIEGEGPVGSVVPGSCLTG